MIVLVTLERSGFDKHSQELAKNLKLPTYRTYRYLSPTQEYNLKKDLEGLKDSVHITNQNFARYFRLLRQPYLVTVHDLIRNFYDFDGETAGDVEQLREDEEGIKVAGHIIAVSEFTKYELIQRLKISNSKITVIPNGLDHEIFKPSGEKFSPDYPYVMIVGSERPRKNYHRLLQAMQDVRKTYPKLRLLKVGDAGRYDSFREKFLAYAEDCGVPVEFTGFIDNEALAATYRGAEMLAFPSLMEGFGLPPLEAMACGCPVVASQIPAVYEVVQNTGILVDPYAVETIAYGIYSVLTHSQYRQHRVEMGLKRAKEFSWKTVAKRTKEVYKNFEHEFSRVY